MKIRSGFVSNSSSSSFTIKLSDLTAQQLWDLLNNDYTDQGLDRPGEWSWGVGVDHGSVHGSTWLDNYRMEDFFDKIGVSENVVQWGE